MNGTFLDKILATRRERVDRQKSMTDLPRLRQHAALVRHQSVDHCLKTTLSRNDRVNIIAEIKRASPSKGVINDAINVGDIARSYCDGGAAAISVLTEEDFFKGSLDDLIAVRNAVELPVLRKDFVVDEFQIYESAAAGADVILLIVAALSEQDLGNILRLTREDLGMDAIVEVHNDDELRIAARVGADIIGVNNRNLSSFEVSLDVSRGLIQKRPPNTLMIAESGLTTSEEIKELNRLGFDGFLIGETLMRSGNPAEALAGFTTK